MPNQQNFPDPLDGTNFQRPNRVSSTDLALIRNTNQQILFGTTNNDVVEVYVYNPDGSFAGHVVVGATDTVLSLTTLIDNSGPYEFINIDMQTVCNRIDLPPGRYSMVANFFRNEVGSESGYKLYISQISDDRTELQLTPVLVTDTVLRDIYEWVTPSVPKVYANGLIDQLFGHATGPTSDILTASNIGQGIDGQIEGTTSRIQYAGMNNVYAALINEILIRTYPLALDLMVQDVFNLNIQQLEIDNYIDTALTTVITQLHQQGQIDNRFAVI